jgi:hypothetical protein
MNYHALRTKTIPLKLLTSITQDCGTSAFAVYSVLLCHAKTTGDDIGQSFPGQELIAEECNVSLSTVQRAIGRLTLHRYIRVTHKQASNGHQSNIYWLAWIAKGEYRWEKDTRPALL